VFRGILEYSGKKAGSNESNMNIAIRKYRESDAAEFQTAVLESLETLEPWLAWASEAYSIENAIEWALTAQSTWEEGSDYRFVIEDSDSDRMLGSVGINQVVPQHKIGNLGYWIRIGAQKQGVCTLAARLAAAYAFDHLGFQRLEIHVPPDNVASIMVAGKLGGQYEGTFRNKLILNGRSVPASCYSIVPDDYNNPVD
jgi:RimJ/RimL family protein N-acetyltransferase